MKKLVLSILFLSFIGFAFADKVELSEARNVAVNAYLEQVNHYLEPASLSDIVIKEHFSYYRNEEEVYYIFNMENYGFIIIAADDAIEPVLGIAYDRQINPDDVPASFTSLMNGYADAVVYCRENNIQPEPEVAAQWEDYQTPQFVEETRETVGPLTLSTWNQGSPYNYFVPDNCPTGCVATSMAQTMYYWRHPFQGEGQHTYYHDVYGYQTANFGETYYDYNGMLDAADGGQVNVPLALIQWHCGIAVDMDYSPPGSGANMSSARNAMVQHFKYKSMAQRVVRSNYNLTVWKDMCRADVDLGRIIMYAGFDNSQGGHCWELDGYNDSDQFHFNFGWGGQADGWYPITNPQGFSQNQEMVYHLEPEDDEYPYYCNDYTITEYHGIIDDGSGPVEDYLNNADCDWLLDISEAGFAPAESITLNVLNMDTEAGNDVVTIYDGGTTNAPILAEVSGSDLPTNIVSTSGVVLIKFETNGSVTGTGWRIEYEVDVSCPSADPYITKDGSFDDGSGEYNYYLGKNCSYFIEPTGASYVTIDFTEFETEENDVVSIYDGTNYSLLGEFSGDLNPLPDPIECPHGKVWILFESDAVESAPGWALNYSSDGTISGIANTEIVSALQMFPNPVNDMLNLKFNSDSRQNIEISIFNMQGQKVYTESMDSFIGTYNNKIDVSDLSKGVYFVNFNGENGFVNKKLVIQ